MGNSLGVKSAPSKRKNVKRESKVSTHATLNFLKSYEEKTRKYELVFPQNFEEKIKILKTLR